MVFKKKFDIAISIGNNCQCRRHIDRVLYDGKNTVGAHVFDGLVTPPDSVIRLLATGFDGAFAINNLSIQTLPNGVDKVFDNFSGISSPHFFKSDENHKLSHASIREQYPELKIKFNYLVDKTINLLKSDQKILLVLKGTVPDITLLKIIDVLKTKYRTNSFKILSCSGNPTRLKHPAIIPRMLKEDPWPGNDFSWDSCFKKIVIKKPKN